LEENFVKRKIMHEEVEVDAKVYSFAPRVFRFIRAIDQIKEYDIMKSVKPQENQMQIFKSNNDQHHSSGGASGSFFFFTQDRKFIIKTITK
jgi:peptide subunit release factor RF-3